MSFIADILEVIHFEEIREACGGSDGETRWFIFGSAARGVSAPNDVDLLLVSDSRTLIIEARRKIRHILKRNPVELIVMSSDEEQELSFVERVGALRIL